MAPRGLTLALAAVLVATVVTTPAAVQGAITCSAVYITLMPCLPYVQAGGTTLLAAADNTPDCRTICGCLKNIANDASGGPYITRVAALPSNCNVSLPYKISTNINCNAYAHIL
ncbi:hypothetical protein ABZP36_024966 [Zizania latifolia]